MATMNHKSLFYVSWFSGILSVLGSSAICYMILSDRKRKLAKVYHRILLGMSICDILQTFWHIMGALPVPVEEGVYGALGNQASCTAQGFFLQFGLSVPCYSGSLALYYVLTTTSKSFNSAMVELKIAKYYEPLMHAVSLLYPLGTAIAGLFLNLYNPVSSGTGCWIAEYPSNCGLNTDIECERGENAEQYVWLFAGLQVFLLLVIIVVCMITIYVKVKRQEQQMLKRYDFSSSSSSSQHYNKNNTDSCMKHNSEEMTLTNSSSHQKSGINSEPLTVAPAGDNPPQQQPQQKRKRSFLSSMRASKDSSTTANSTKEAAKKRMDKTKFVANQAMWYIGTFLLTFIWSCFLAFSKEDSASTLKFCLDLAQEFFLPMQGFFTFLVYIKPRYGSFRQDHLDKSRWWCLKQAVFSKETVLGRNRARRASLQQSYHEKSSCAAGGDMASSSLSKGPDTYYHHIGGGACVIGGHTSGSEDDRSSFSKSQEGSKRSCNNIIDPALQQQLAFMVESEEEDDDLEASTQNLHLNDEELSPPTHDDGPEDPLQPEQQLLSSSSDTTTSSSSDKFNDIEINVV